MEYAIKAPCDGVLEAYRAEVGDLVAQGDLLVDFTVLATGKDNE